jgi:glycosyltransferase involved in cell wall biosynthesis
MEYPIFDIDVTDPFPEIPLSRFEQGCALLIRRKGKPLEFLLPDVARIAKGRTDSLAQVIAAYAGKQILENAIQDELQSHVSESVVEFPAVTAVLCTHGRPAYAARCLDSLQRITFPLGFSPTKLELLLVDNAPTDNQTRELVKKFSGIHYICEKKPGLDFARNRAWSEATGSIVAYIDDDVVVDRGWLQGLLEAYRAYPAAGGFTGLILPFELATQAQFLFEKRGGFRKGFNRIVYGHSLPRNPLYPAGIGIIGTGANMAFRKDLLERIGGFDEALDTGASLPGGGDLDMFYRMIRSGNSIIYEPSYLAFHQHRREISALRRQYRSWGLGMMAFVAKAYQADTGEREKLRRLVAWWLRYQMRLLIRGLKGQKEYRADFIFAELMGGVFGLCGEYGRSLRRIQSIRRSAG